MRNDSRLVSQFAVLVLSLGVVVASAAPAWPRAPLLDETRGVLTLAPMLEQVTPAVVNISVAARVTGDENPLMRDPFFRRFFGLPEGAPNRPDGQAMAAGSGVIIDAPKGYVLTNHHVVANGDRITVTLKDGRQLKAELIGSDAATDLALLKVEPKGLTAVPLADSDALKVGDVVLAIGNPFGLGQTVTSGIVSALGRSGLNADNYEDFIQTDAPINPGNSGGALVNSKGELVGINTAIIAPGGGNVGIGFAVPANMVKAIVAQLEQFREVRRGRIGITVQSITPDIAASLGLPVAQGVIVTSIERSSPAERAALKPGDAILEIDGKPVLNASDLRTRIGLRAQGSALVIKYFRQGKQQTVSVVIGAAEKAKADVGQIVRQLAGAHVTEIPESAPLKGKIDGVYVAEVAAGSAAARLGLRTGDIIVAVNQKAVRTVAEFESAAHSAGPIVALSLQRGVAQLFIVAQS